MIVSKAEAQSSTDRQSAAIAVFAIICVLLSWATNSYERHLVEMYIPRRETVSGDFDELIEQFFLVMSCSDTHFIPPNSADHCVLCGRLFWNFGWALLLSAQIFLCWSQRVTLAV